LLAIPDETRLEVAVVVLVEQVDHLAHQRAVQGGRRSGRRRRGTSARGGSRRAFRGCVDAAADDHREVDVLECREDVVVGIVVDSGVRTNP